MYILCSISGITYQTTLFNKVSLSSREHYHPIFSAPLKILKSLTEQYSADITTFSDQETYLLFLALLNSTDLIDYQIPAKLIPVKTISAITSCFPSLLEILPVIYATPNRAKVFASYSITTETCTLEDIPNLIKTWKDNSSEYIDGYKSVSLSERIATRQTVLEPFIKNTTLDPAKYATHLAEWAALAGQFPDFAILNPITHTSTTCSYYWKQLIKACCNEEKIFSLPTSDLQELLEHCEENISAGSIYANKLFQVLRTGQDHQKNYLGLGDINISEVGFVILSPETSIEDANKAALIASAPQKLPLESEYPNRLAYLQAKAKWDMAARNKLASN